MNGRLSRARQGSISGLLRQQTLKWGFVEALRDTLYKHDRRLVERSTRFQKQRDGASYVAAVYEGH